MARRYSIADARIRLAAIVDQAEAGTPVELTRRGRPVAIVVSLREFERRHGDRPRFSDAYKSFLAKYSLEEVGVGDSFARSLRAKDSGRKVSL